MNSFGPKLQKCSTHNIAFNVISKMLKQPNFFYSQPSTLPKDTLAKFYLSTTFDLSFMITSVASTRSSTFYTYLITRIGNHNLNHRQTSVNLISQTHADMWCAWAYCFKCCIVKWMCCGSCDSKPTQLSVTKETVVCAGKLWLDCNQSRFVIAGCSCHPLNCL